MQFVQAYPGLHLSEIARRLQWSVTLAEYHLRVLERSRLVSTTKLGGSRCYFAVGQAGAPGGAAVAAGQRGLLVLLRHPMRLHIATLLASRPGCANHEIAGAVGLSRPATSHHLNRLRRGGVVERDAAGLYRLLQPHAVVPLLRAQRPPPDQVERFQALWDDLMA